MQAIGRLLRTKFPPAIGNGALSGTPRAVAVAILADRSDGHPVSGVSWLSAVVRPISAVVGPTDGILRVRGGLPRDPRGWIQLLLT